MKRKRKGKREKIEKQMSRMQMQQKRIANLISFCAILLVAILLLPFSIVIPQVESSIITSSPVIISSSVYPTKVQPGDLLTVTISVLDFFGVKKVQADFFHEHGFNLVNLSLVSGTIFRGVWQGQWVVHDTKIKEYTTVVTVFSRSGGSSSVNLSWYDPAPWWDLDWSYRKLITLNHNQVPSTQTNFPVLLNITDTDLKDTAQSDGDDIVFADINGNKLNHQIESYASGTGALVAWVNVTSLSSSSDTEIYIYYGNAGCSNQQNTQGVWDGNYIAVWHMNSLSDSTSYGNTLTLPGGGSNPTATSSGKIVSAYSFDGNDRFPTGITTQFTDFSVSIWFKDNADNRAYERLADKSYTGGFWIGRNNGAANSWGGGIQQGSAPYGIFVTLPDGAWNNLVFMRNGTTQTLIGNGGGVSTSQAVTSNALDTTSMAVGGYGGGGSEAQWFTGTLDEVRVSKIARSAAWINAEYNTIENATNGGFFSMGSEEVAIPTKPTLTSPVNNGYTNDIIPTFQWTNGENQENNTLHVSNESDFLVEHINVSLASSTTSYATPVGYALSEGRRHWRVVANNSQGTNSSETWSFIVDTTPPLSVNLSSPANGSASESSSVTFSWSSTTDNTTNTSQVSDIAYYTLQVDNDQDFSSPLVDENTLDNATLSLTETVTGQLHWRVRAVDNAGNAGEFSEIRNLTVFNFSLTASTVSLQILRGTTSSTSLTIEKVFGEHENITLSCEWQGIEPGGITIALTTEQNKTDFTSTLSFQTSGDTDTGEFTCRINAISSSNITRNIDVKVGVIGMSYLVLANPASVSMIRSDTATATITVIFMMGAKDIVSLSGEWQEITPAGVDVAINPSSGTPSYSSNLTFDAGASADAGSFKYRVTSTGGGLTQWADIYVEIKTALNVNVSTDKQTYQKGQNIQISGTAKDPENNPVSSGTATINLSTKNWSHTLTASIANGVYSANYYITFD
ncbi:MAG: DUF2341 domain-containing protein, partial [Euryarchaeota archaeon]|nr:DUF2341 domain-containing protein [Euryarchaeota archaeon]